MVQLLSHFLIHATKFIWWEDFGCVPKPIHQGMIFYKWKREPEGQSTREQAERWRIKNERGCSRLIVLRMTFELLKFSLSPIISMTWSTNDSNELEIPLVYTIILSGEKAWQLTQFGTIRKPTFVILMHYALG